MSPATGQVDRAVESAPPPEAPEAPPSPGPSSSENGSIRPRTRYREDSDRPRRIKAQVLSVLAAASGAMYFALLPGGLNPSAPVVGTVFILAELSCLVLFVLAAVNVWNLRFKPRSGLAAERPMDVDVFITVCGEPRDVVERSLSSAARLRWEGTLKVWVLDDGGDPWVEQRARDLGFLYLSRPKAGLSRENAKAGNLNFGLRHSHGELVMTLDADHLVRPDALLPMAGYFRFERVAFVQSKQHFIVPEGDPFNARDPVFYDAVQLGYDNDDTVISCGSGVLYRRAALEDIGGFVEWNLVEDLTTSYELHARGWKSFYFPFPVTAGLAPGTIREVYQQRGQWCTDSMRIFFWDNPLFKKGLSWPRRLNHFMIGLTYVWSGFFIPVFFFIPLWSYLSGQPLFVDHQAAIIATRLLYFVLFALAAEYLFRSRDAGKQFQFLAGLFPVYVWGTLKALLHPPGRRPGYRVNNTGGTPTRRRLPGWLVLWPQLLVFGAHVLLPVWAMVHGISAPWLIAGNAVVSCFVIWTLWPVIVAGIRHRADALAVAGLTS